MATEGYHEKFEKLTEATLDGYRAKSSLMEELEAVDWYDQYIDATGDPDLKAILAHNRDEEKEHAAIVPEWLRWRAPELSRHLKTCLFTEGSILEREEEAEQGHQPVHGQSGP